MGYFRPTLSGIVVIIDTADAGITAVHFATGLAATASRRGAMQLIVRFACALIAG